MAPNQDLAGGETRTRPPARSPSMEPGEIPIATYSDVPQASYPSSNGSPRMQAGFSQTQGASALASPPALSQEYTMTANEAASAQAAHANPWGRGDESLPPSSAAASFVASQEYPPPPLAQPKVAWKDVPSVAPLAPQQTPLTWLPIVTPAQVAVAAAQQDQAQAIQSILSAQTGSSQGEAVTAPKGGGWKVVNRRKRPRPATPFREARDQRRKLEEMSMRKAMADPSPGPGMPSPTPYEGANDFFTTGALEGGRLGQPPPNPFEMALQSNSAFPSPSPVQRASRKTKATAAAATAARTPPSPPISSSDYYNPGDLLAAGMVPDIPAQMRAPSTEEMAVDPSLSAVQPFGDRLAPRGVESASTMNIPLRAFGASGTLAHQYTVQTPRQQQDILNPALTGLPRRQPAQQPFGGPYVLRDAPPHRDHGLTPGLQPAQRGGTVATRGNFPPRRLDSAPPPEEYRVRREHVPLDDEQLNDPFNYQEENQENLAPALVLRGTLRAGTRFEEQVGEDFRRLADSRASSAAGARHSTPMQAPVNPLTGRVSKVGRQQSAVMRYPEPAIPQCVLHPRMKEPEGGYPQIRFNDPDSLVVGTDEAILADMRNIEKNGEILGIRVARVNGVPPDKTTRNICSWVETITTDITGETSPTLVPPRPPHARRGGDTPFVWFLCNLSPEGAAVMLDVGVVSCPTITFFVHPLTVKPDVVIVLAGFVTTAGFQIEAMIRNVFEGKAMRAVIDQFVPTNPLFHNTPTDLATQFVLETLEIELDSLGGNVPCAKVYIQSPSGTTDGWRRFREAVACIPFEDLYNPRASTRSLTCDVCGGNDHTMQMCRYPTLPGWRGPVVIQEQINEEPVPMGSDLVFAPRPGGGNQKKQTGGRGGGGYAPSGSQYGGQNFGGGGRGSGAGAGGSGLQGMRPY
ncbi:hypothetical protein K466DRAFT_564218 [Polyporus arcularius HHB13444]|uniref:Uncharacterized protein n=1 Tax=Polyporus arcularius HHB13444 TaxID=1314778 RepID=A0A5C3PHL3_9APHY|nr:hypothetical protein K466DRAFT_564218 [Polyporus arcularius HHB13444]